MVKFGIRRLASFAADRRYHLFDDEGQLVLVADYNSPWLPPSTNRQVRLARPDGKLIATLEPENARLPSQQGRSRTSYAIIYDYAVYAIINQFRDEILPHPYYTLEVEGRQWLALPDGKAGDIYLLYDAVAWQPGNHTLPDPTTLPDATGRLQRGGDGYDYTISLPEGALRQHALLGQAVVFLIDGG